MNILIAEDDKEIAQLEKDYLEMQGYEVDWVADGHLVEHQLQEQEYDLLLLDIMLPNKDGYAICKEIRKVTDIPILMVTAKQETADLVRGLGLGADDYISKPFDPMELVARVKAHIERYQRLKPAKETVISIGDITIFPDNWLVEKEGKPIKLTNREFELLVYLAKHPNQVFSKETLFEHIWGFDYMGDSATVTVHVNRLREKLGSTIIETVWGAGYRLSLV